MVAGLAVVRANNGKPEDGQGKYADLTSLWWQWAYGQETAFDGSGNITNPILDDNGAYATVGQENGIGPDNKLFFLAGDFGGAVTRTVTVPKGKDLFFPVVNFEVDNVAFPPVFFTNFTVPQLRAMAKASIDAAAGLLVTLDGTDITSTIFRTKSPTFAYTLPDEDTIYDFLYTPAVMSSFDGMTIHPAVSDGYWCFISHTALAPGVHELHFEGGIPSAGFSLDVTYELTIP